MYHFSRKEPVDNVDNVDKLALDKVFPNFYNVSGSHSY